jgi:hypothetical protein
MLFCTTLLIPVSRWPPDPPKDELDGGDKKIAVEAGSEPIADGSEPTADGEPIFEPNEVVGNGTVPSVEDSNALEPDRSADTLAGSSDLKTDPMEPTPAPQLTRPPLKDIVMTRSFILASAVVFTLPFGSMSPAYWGAQFGREKLGMSPTDAAFAVSILNISSTVGRVVQGILADYVGGPSTNNFFSILVAGLLLMLVWPNVKTPGQFQVYMCLQGLAGGSYNGVVGLGCGVIVEGDAEFLTHHNPQMPQVISLCFPVHYVATAFSLVYSFFAPGSVAGPVLQGLLIDISTTTLPDGTKDVNFLPMMLFSGGTVLVSAGFALGLRMHMSKGKWWVKI